LRKKYNELNVTLRQIGVDEEKSFVDERILIGERLYAKDYQPFLVQFAKRGVPPSLRNRVYKKILYAESSRKDFDYYNQQFEQAAKWELAIDEMITTDILDICNDDKYFIFQDMIESGVMFFFRDKQIPEMLKSKPHTPVIAVAGSDKQVGPYPPSSVIPCHRFSRYFAPFCYISEKKEEAYFIFRAMYCKYFCYLHSLSSHSQSIITLTKLFEDLLQMYEPDVCYHLN